MLRAIKIRLYPDKDQKSLFAQHFGASRFIFNWTLNKKNEYYKKEKKSLSIYQIQRELTQLKTLPEYNWLQDVSIIALQQATFDVDAAFNMFFKKVNDYPKFKSKRHPKQSYRVVKDFKINSEDFTISVTRERFYF